MEQRSLRLGDIVDDYCPRERRVTNHAIVAIVENAIRQTRCSTCQAEHEYKEAKVPKKKLAGGVLVVAKPSEVTETAETTEVAETDEQPVTAQPAEVAAEAEAASGAETEGEPNGNTLPDGWVGHRPLIRASLPRTDNDPPPPRAIPEFTMHQRQGRGFGSGRGFRHGHSGGHSNNGAFRHTNNPSGGGGGNEPDGNRPSQPGRPPGGGGGRRRRRRRPR